MSTAKKTTVSALPLKPKGPRRPRKPKKFCPSEQIMRDNLIVLAQAYASANNRALSTVSNQIHGKHSFLEEFIGGRVSVTLSTYFAMIGKMREAWPKGAKWPRTRKIPGPARTPLKTMPSRADGGRFVKGGVHA